MVVPDWQMGLSRRLQDKLAVAPDSVVSFLAKKNKEDGYDAVPRAVPLTAEFRSAYRGAVAQLPDRVWGLVESRLVAVYVVEGLGSSGFTEALADRDGKLQGTMVVVDATVLSRSANEWATWKETSPFVDEPGFGLAAVIEDSANDTPTNALQYLLLNEFGHVIAVTQNVLPKWNTQPASKIAAFPFASYSWRDVRGTLLYENETSFSTRSRIRYYAPATEVLPMSLALKAYSELVRTPYPTLYSSKNVDDDFAESFATYVHTQLMHRPWKIILRSPAAPTRVVESCWSEPRCADKRRFLNAMLRESADQPAR